MNVPRPDIFTYHDYQAFLRDWLAYRKASQSDFSLRMLAKQADLASGYLPMVLNGKRPLSTAALAKLLPFLGWNPREQSFFEQLLLLGTSDSHEVRVAALDRMQRFQQFQKLNSRDSVAYAYLTHWYYVAIRELATMPGFSENPRWIQSQLKVAVPLKEIKEALSFLLAHGYLQRSPEGTIYPPEKALDCSGGVYRVALTKFHREIFKLAVQSIENTPSPERSIQGHTCALSPENIEKAKIIADEAISRIRDLGQNEKQGEAIYHMEVALFPLTQRKGIGQ